MAEDVQPGTLPPVQPDAFGTGNPSDKVIPTLPQDTLGNITESKLDQILAFVKEGKGAEAAAVVDTVARPTTPETKVTEPTEAAVPNVSPTGNKALDVAVRTFVDVTGTSEDDITKAMSAAYEAGDARYIDRDFLKERYGDKAEQAIALVEAVFEADTKAQQDLLDSVYSAAGGQEQFEAYSAVFKEHAKPAMRSVIKNMLDSGDPAAVQEATSLIVEFGKQSGVVVQKQGTKHMGSAGMLPGQGLSATEFQAARQLLNPTARTYRDDFAALIEQRRIGKQLGK